MNDHENIAKELTLLHTSIPVGVSGRFFEVPEDYFNSLPMEVLEEINSQITTRNFTKALPYHVPTGYFDRLSDAVLQKLYAIPADEEIAEISPLLAGLKNKQPYEAPKEFARPKQPAITIPFVSHKRHAQKRMKWTSWAAAAAVVCIFTIGGAGFLNSQPEQSISNSEVRAELAAIPDAVIQQYLDENMSSYDLYAHTTNDRMYSSNRYKRSNTNGI